MAGYSGEQIRWLVVFLAIQPCLQMQPTGKLCQEVTNFTSSLCVRMGGRFKMNKRKYSAQRAIRVWDILPENVMMAIGIDGFQRGLDTFMEDWSISY